jgi:hydroxymethylglutaryl-CoA lyase
MNLPRHVTVVEVGPRDGLQNESAQVAADPRVGFVDRLSAAGCPVIEVGAFVSPKWVPQMAGTEQVIASISRRTGTRYSALVPNLTGLDRARAAGLTDVAIFAAASEAFSRKNINASIDDSLATYRDVCARAAEYGMRVRAYVSTAFGCPFEGAVAPEAVGRVARALIEMDAYEVALSDTIGIAHPGQVPVILGAVRSEGVRLQRIALHFHDTRGTALANVLAALDLGVTTFDSSAGGLGGCPYAPGATGNLATEDLVYMLDGLGVTTGIDLASVVAATEFMTAYVGHAPASRYVAALRAARASTPSDAHRSSN